MSDNNPSPSVPFSRVAVAACLAATVVLSACGGGDKPAGAPGGPGSAPPPAQVGVITVQPGALDLVTELPGRLEASRVAQVRARATGIVQQRLFTEGSAVRAGQPLFRIDSAPYEAVLASARAQQAKAEVQVAQTQAQWARLRPLVTDKAVSEQEATNAELAVKQAEADLALAKAAVQTASINRGYADVTAPIAGRVGRANVTEGALVAQTDATPMAVVQQIDPLYINFTQSASEAMALARAVENGQLKRSGTQAAAVKVVLEDGTEHPQPGKLLFSDLTVDPTSGQVTLRAEVPNPGGRLLPGLYVRVRLVQAQASDAIALPQQAVTRSPKGDSVMVVDTEGKVSPRPVKLGGQQGGRWVVLDGLKAGEQVMVDGFQKLRGDAPVKAVPWQAPGTAPKAAAAGATAPGSAPASASAPAPAAAAK
ncbi:MAG TPA: efflux RND transporter periplasmic adaptor subunit [Burkholderiaceae bacterium]|nr:efflux RND transporter periplasmic adaptor subunit [Burkholderiaceae bacterium]